MIRLNKYMADCGVDSRRNCDKIILEGRVRVNRKLVNELGFMVNEDNDTVTVDGRKIVLKSKNVYIMLHKPKGYVTTVKDEKERKTVMELVDVKARVYPVGRLDYDTEGLLILTNDGDLTYKLTHPKYEVTKKYVARIEGEIEERDLEQLRRGVEVDGKKTAPAKAKLVEKYDDGCKVELTIHEGRNHQVKKMFEAIGKNVAFLKRTEMGEIRLGGLGRGKWRHLNDKEIAYLRELK
ncbi:MAG: rRNA pseudouridine synthase [Clostridia bacterium]|nr:rRNA pseudouridine synthase [Clostridia bacterium]